MTTETGALSADAGGSAEKATGTAEAGTTDDKAQETPEQKQVREANERAAKLEEDLKNERALRLSQQNKVEQANQVLRGGAATDAPASPTGATPEEAQALQRLYAEWQQYGLATTESQIVNLEAQIRERVGRQRLLDFVTEADKVIEALDNPDVKARAKQIIRAGVTNDPQIAIAAARGQIAQEKAATRTTTTTKTETVEGAARVDTSAASVASVSGPKLMPYSEYLQRTGSDAPDAVAAEKLIRDVDAGRVKLDYTR